MNIDHINLTVPNLEEAVMYYKNLGFKEVARFNNNKMEFVFLTDGTITYEFIENATIDSTKIDHIAYISNDIKKDFKHYKNLGLTITDLNYVEALFEDGMDYFFIKGSHNERIEFCSRRIKK